MNEPSTADDIPGGPEDRGLRPDARTADSMPDISYKTDVEFQAGDMLLTGAWGPPIPIAGQTRVHVTSSASGDVSAMFA